MDADGDGRADGGAPWEKEVDEDDEDDEVDGPAGGHAAGGVGVGLTGVSGRTADGGGAAWTEEQEEHAHARDAGEDQLAT